MTELASENMVHHTLTGRRLVFRGVPNQSLYPMALDPQAPTIEDMLNAPPPPGPFAYQGKPGCPHRIKYTGTSTIERRKPGFMQSHPTARVGFEWEACAEADCEWARCMCIDPEIAGATEPPTIINGVAYFTVKQALLRAGLSLEAHRIYTIGKLIARGKLEGFKQDHRGRTRWLITAASAATLGDTEVDA